MRCEIRSLPAAILVAAFLAAGVSAGEKAVVEKKPPDPTPLVRADLLKVLPPEPEAPIRDIFSPGRAVAAPEPISASKVPEAPAGKEPGLETPSETAPLEPVLDLTYIGYVRSGRKVVALVISERQAVAVAEGEEIVPGLKVEKIGLDRIDVVGPDGKRTSVPIQGEKP
jgi:hypothetical protein